MISHQRFCSPVSSSSMLTHGYIWGEPWTTSAVRVPTSGIRNSEDASSETVTSANAEGAVKDAKRRAAAQTSVARPMGDVRMTGMARACALRRPRNIPRSDDEAEDEYPTLDPSPLTPRPATQPVRRG